jgi:SAM-dependent methyltransferase
MGSQAIQGQLWGQRPKDWADIQEETGNVGYIHALRLLNLKLTDKLLDVGCGTGLFSSLASAAGAAIIGIDASEALIEEARKRRPSINFMTGEMEELPFADSTFDVVCGFNSFQYAADFRNAFTETKRVLKPNGKLIVMVWGNQEDCEAASYLKAVGSLLPPPPPGTPGPFALSENQLLENTLEALDFKIIDKADIDSVWDYPDKDTALKGLIAAGPVARAIDHNGYKKTYDTINEAIQPYIQPNGHVVYHNKFRIVVAEK